MNVLRNIAQIPSDLPKNKVNSDKMIHIKNDHEESVEIDTNQDIMFLYQDLYLGQKCPRLSSSKTNPHLHFKFTKPNSYSPQVYRRIVKKYFIKKFNKYYPSETLGWRCIVYLLRKKNCSFNRWIYSQV